MVGHGFQKVDIFFFYKIFILLLVSLECGLYV